MMTRLTRRRSGALLDVANEFLSGHDAEMAEACGIAPPGQGDRFLDDLAAAVMWLRERLEKK